MHQTFKAIALSSGFGIQTLTVIWESLLLFTWALSLKLRWVWVEKDSLKIRVGLTAGGLNYSTVVGTWVTRVTCEKEQKQHHLRAGSNPCNRIWKGRRKFVQKAKEKTTFDQCESDFGFVFHPLALNWRRRVSSKWEPGSWTRIEDTCPVCWCLIVPCGLEEPAGKKLQMISL